jgi:chromosomal replication initiator protein
MLNPQFTFDTFIVSDSNNFAWAAARAVADSPGKSYNPLLIYGDRGTGKTHLLHAIGHAISSRHPKARITCVSAENIATELVESVQTVQISEFRNKYLQSDLLLIDDVQHLAGKIRLQEEFFHTFNALLEKHIQIVLTCDRSPGDLAGLERRLAARFEWGMVADLQPHDKALLQAIARTNS